LNGIGINMIVRLTTLIAATLASAACSSPPQAPTVDDAKKRPVNVSQAIDVQSCRSELAATRIVLTESLDHPRIVTVPAKPLDAVPAPNQVFVINFPLGSATVELSATEQAKLIEQARTAKFIVIRGRTDATTDSLAETNLARQRAEATYSYLTSSLKVSLPAEGIRMSWQGAGDRAQPQDTAPARQANRRVEIELYPVKPAVQVLAPATS
jgi:outer membrane protein OmpA-like peptidoglycan-associated protein